MGLALAGSTMASAQGTFDGAKGTTLYSPCGEKLGKVKQVVAVVRGKIDLLMWKLAGPDAVLPSAGHAASGDMLVTGMSEAEIAQAGAAQD